MQKGIERQITLNPGLSVAPGLGSLRQPCPDALTNPNQSHAHTFCDARHSFIDSMYKIFEPPEKIIQPGKVSEGRSNILQKIDVGLDLRMF